MAAAGTLAVSVLTLSNYNQSSVIPTTTNNVAYCAGNSTNDKTKKSSNNKVVIVGGGTAGIGVAAMLQHEGVSNVTIVEPKTVHYYQPLWTLVGGGVKQNKDSVKPMKDIIPKGTKWMKNAVTTFQPETNSITLDDGTSVEYDYLVVAAGIQTNWDTIPGVKEGLSKEGSGVCSVYDFEYSAKTWKEFNRIKKESKSSNNKDGGSKINMVFTFSPTVLKCAGAPMKIM